MTTAAAEEKALAKRQFQVRDHRNPVLNRETLLRDILDAVAFADDYQNFYIPCTEAASLQCAQDSATLSRDYQTFPHVPCTKKSSLQCAQENSATKEEAQRLDYDTEWRISHESSHFRTYSTACVQKRTELLARLLSRFDNCVPRFVDAVIANLRAHNVLLSDWESPAFILQNLVFLGQDFPRNVPLSFLQEETRRLYHRVLLPAATHENKRDFEEVDFGRNQTFLCYLESRGFLKCRPRRRRRRLHMWRPQSGRACFPADVDSANGGGDRSAEENEVSSDSDFDWAAEAASAGIEGDSALYDSDSIFPNSLKECRKKAIKLDRFLKPAYQQIKDRFAACTAPRLFLCHILRFCEILDRECYRMHLFGNREFGYTQRQEIVASISPLLTMAVTTVRDTLHRAANYKLKSQRLLMEQRARSTVLDYLRMHGFE